MSDNFGDRMKMYEKRETSRFMPLLPIYIRLDGKNFSKFTKGMKRPFDENMQKCMIETTKQLVAETTAKIGYTQSDEINLVFYSDSTTSQVYFDGKIQKIISVLASLCTSIFSKNINRYLPEKKDDNAIFDCRAFTLPNLIEASNAILWREQDATKNAVSMACRSFYSHKEMMGKNRSEMQEMLFQKGINFNDYPSSFKRGTFIQREAYRRIIGGDQGTSPTGMATRHRIIEIDMPIFSKVTNRVDVIFKGEKPQIEFFANKITYL